MIKKYCIKIGFIIATLMMLTPLAILFSYSHDQNNITYLFLFICSIFYDIYFYTIIKFENSKEEVKNHYYRYVKNEDKRLNLNIPYKEKYKILEEYVENLINTYF